MASQRAVRTTIFANENSTTNFDRVLIERSQKSGYRKEKTATEVQQIMEELGKIADDEGSADGLKNFIR